MAFDLEKFTRQVYTAATEIVDQEVDVFNAQSGNSILLAPSSANVGDFTMEASFKAISNLVRRRDVNNGENAVTPVRLQHLKDVSVKVASGTPPIVFEPAQYDWIQRDPAEAALVIGEQLAQAMLQDQLNVAVAALVGAINANSDLVTTSTSTAAVGDLAPAAGKFGDRMASVIGWVMHSKVWIDIYGSLVGSNGHVENLFQYGNVLVRRDPLGRAIIVTDCPSLVNGTDYITLGLVQQAALVEPNNDFRAVLVDTTGKENIQRTYQSEWSYNLGLLGYAWDTAAGGSAPTNTSLGTGSNWKKIATSNKDTAGVALVTK